MVNILGPVASWMHEEREELVLRRDLEAQIAIQLEKKEGLSSVDAKETASSFLDLVVEYSGMLVEVAPGVFQFHASNVRGVLSCEGPHRQA